jgi:hypothetical protein
MTARLDTRAALYGEQRLSDVQVIALRAAAQPDGLVPSGGAGWSGGGAIIGSGTVLALRRKGLLDMAGDGVAASPEGRKIIAAIDMASASAAGSTGGM